MDSLLRQFLKAGQPFRFEMHRFARPVRRAGRARARVRGTSNFSFLLRPPCFVNRSQIASGENPAELRRRVADAVVNLISIVSHDNAKIR